MEMLTVKLVKTVELSVLSGKKKCTVQLMNLTGEKLTDEQSNLQKRFATTGTLETNDPIVGADHAAVRHRVDRAVDHHADDLRLDRDHDRVDHRDRVDHHDLVGVDHLQTNRMQVAIVNGHDREVDAVADRAPVSFI